MMQAFYWNVPRFTPAGSWWRNIETRAAEIARAGFTSAWIPPPYKGASGADDVGYAVYDRYDLGEFDQKGSVATRYGTLAELDAAIDALHRAGVDVYADIVMNHMLGADEQETFTAGGTTFTVWTGFTHPGRQGRHSAYRFSWRNFSGCDQGGWKQWAPWDFEPADDAWDNLLGCELRFRDDGTRGELLAWGRWLSDRLRLDGYRLDAVKHMHTPFVIEWLDQIRGDRFAVAEAWFGDLDRLLAYADALGGRARLFDVPLHGVFVSMSGGNGSWDMRGLRFAGLTERRGQASVSFVDNHDTDTPGPLHSPVVNLKMLAYAYILLRDKGLPCVFYKDFYEYGLGAAITDLIRIRNRAARGGGFEHDESDQDVYVYSRAGDDTGPGLLLLLNDGPAARRVVRTPFRSARLVDETGQNAGEVTTDAAGQGELAVGARSYAVWVPR